MQQQDTVKTKLMLQKKEYNNTTKTNATKEGIPTATKIPVAPTKTNATKEGIPATPQKQMLQKKEYQQQQNKN